MNCSAETLTARSLRESPYTSMVSPWVPGAEFGGDVRWGGVDLTQFVDKDLDVEIQDGVHAIKGIYN